MREIGSEALIDQEMIQYVLEDRLYLGSGVVYQHAVKVVLSMRLSYEGQRGIQLSKFEACSMLESVVLIKVLVEPPEVSSGGTGTRQGVLELLSSLIL